MKTVLVAPDHEGRDFSGLTLGGDVFHRQQRVGGVGRHRRQILLRPGRVDIHPERGVETRHALHGTTTGTTR